MGNLNQDTGAITGVLLTAARPAMFEVQQNFNPLFVLSRATCVPECRRRSPFRKHRARGAGLRSLARPVELHLPSTIPLILGHS